MRARSRAGLILLTAVCLSSPALPPRVHAARDSVIVDLSSTLVDDRRITIASPEDVAAKRAVLIRHLWGEGGFPKDAMPESVERDAFRPDNLKNLGHVDTLHIAMETGLKGLSHHFVPKARKKNRLVVLHLGHVDNCTFNDDTPKEPDIGMRRTVNALLSVGFSVLAVYMPQITPEDCRWDHERLFTLAVTGSPMKFFLEPTALSLNHLLAAYPHYTDVSMIGLSGGGWTTTVYAAIDPRIRRSFPVAGSLPLYLRWGLSRGDVEQNLESFYRLAGYLDLYVMGSFGPGRRQIQVLNRRDDCCFGERQHNAAEAGMRFGPAVRGYERRVKETLRRLGSGSFEVSIDEVAPRHMISRHTIEKVILPALGR